MKITKSTKQIDCHDASLIFSRIHENGDKSFLFESRDVSNIYGRLSLIGVDPVLEIKGKNEEFCISGLNERAAFYIKNLKHKDLAIADELEISENEINGRVKKDLSDFEEGQRTRRKNIAQVIRIFLERFSLKGKEFIGLYGAFSYDFIRLFEEIPEILEDNEVQDFRLLLFDTFVFFDHLKDQAEIIAYRENLGQAKKVCGDLDERINKAEKTKFKFQIISSKFDLEKNEYLKLVENARELAKKGELFEIVYSNTLRGDFEGDPFALYKIYRDVNPSPYLYFFNFGDEQLIGASPEMMVRCENGLVHLRPISGTAKRGEDPIEDHENMLELLKSEKERSELDMLIDLGRNDLTRICEPGIKISDYRFVEKYSKVMHTVAHLTGVLKKEFTALDSLIACLNAGTLTGAPKVAAMIEIEKNEKSRRGYYGGTIGYFALTGNMDTGIIIRTAHIKNGKFSFRVGATLLYDSDCEAEYQEVLNKASAFLTTINHV